MLYGPTGSLQGWLYHEDCLHAKHLTRCRAPKALLQAWSCLGNSSADSTHQSITDQHGSFRRVSVDGKSSVKGLSLLRAAIAERRFLPMLPDSLRTNHLTRYGG